MRRQPLKLNDIWETPCSLVEMMVQNPKGLGLEFREECQKSHYSTDFKGRGGGGGGWGSRWRAWIMASLGSFVGTRLLTTSPGSSPLAYNHGIGYLKKIWLLFRPLP